MTRILALIVAISLAISGCSSSGSTPKGSREPGSDRAAARASSGKDATSGTDTRAGESDRKGKGKPGSTGRGDDGASEHRGAGQSRGQGRDSDGGSDGGATSAGEAGSGSGGETPSNPLPEGAALTELAAASEASVQDVPMLHNLAVGLGRTGGIPPSVTEQQAEVLQKRFTKSAKAARGAGGAALAVVFDSYAALAGQLAAVTEADKALPDGFADDLRAADGAWKPAMQRLGDATGADLLANLPPLLLPGSSPSDTIPPPPK